ncbi:MAG: hypothetical protein ACYTG1_08510 [Planctomycetota bacterium]|jgi:hypothetical protein
MPPRRAALPAVVVALAAASGPAPPGPAAPPVAPSAALRQAIALLTAEAEAARAGDASIRAETDFAAASGLAVDPRATGARLLRPVHRDPFVDAYVRWQLTGFRVELPALTGRQLAAVLDDLPAYAPNPWAGRPTIALLNRAVRAGVLPEPEQERLAARLDALSAEASRAAARNEPARRLRDWLAERLDATPGGRLRCELARCAALVDAGWDCERRKVELERHFEAAARDPRLDDDDRRELAAVAGRLAGRRRAYVRSARLEDGAAAVVFDDTGVYDFDVRRWVRLLAAP